MKQIKIFKGIENDLAALEDEINTWLVESDAEVLQVSGNIAPQRTGSNRQTGRFTVAEVFPPAQARDIFAHLDGVSARQCW